MEKPHLGPGVIGASQSVQLPQQDGSSSPFLLANVPCKAYLKISSKQTTEISSFTSIIISYAIAVKPHQEHESSAVLDGQAAVPTIQNPVIKLQLAKTFWDNFPKVVELHLACEFDPVSISCARCVKVAINWFLSFPVAWPVLRGMVLHRFDFLLLQVATSCNATKPAAVKVPCNFRILGRLRFTGQRWEQPAREQLGNVVHLKEKGPKPSSGCELVGKANK